MASTATRQTGRIVELRDGTKALIRPIGPWDRERLNEGFKNASTESIFMRFLAPMPLLSSSQLDYLTAVDHIRHEALIAVGPETGQSFGTARFFRSDDQPETAEFAVGVGDQWMRIGLGTALLSALVLRAREAGVIRFTGWIHTGNTPIRRLMEKVGGAYEARFVGQGAIEVAIDLLDVESGRPDGPVTGGLSRQPPRLLQRRPRTRARTSRLRTSSPLASRSVRPIRRLRLL